MNFIQRLLSVGLVMLLCSGSLPPDKQLKRNLSTKEEWHYQNNHQKNEIIGDWALQVETYDENGNHVLDEAERKKAFSNQYFYRFNSNGSCLINARRTAQGAFKGHYTTKMQNGKTVLDIFLDEGGTSESAGEYTVASVNKDEMVLLETIHNRAFWIFKRMQ
jgi:hypothetical protein